MKVTGIIAEYNPFHNGHLYHLQKAREETEADYLIIVMSGNFVQQGGPAIIDKYARAKMALNAGADLVLELPVYFATSSADYFARGAVALLDRLGVVDCLSFGSEHGEIAYLCGIASLSAVETPAFSAALNRYLTEGKSFAYANTHALMDSCEDEDLKKLIEDITIQPNNALGISYIRNLLQRSSSIQPHTIYRKGSAFHDDSAGALSATSVRSELMRTKDVRSLRSQVPDHVLKELTAGMHQTFPITKNDFSGILLYKLRSMQFVDELYNKDEANTDREITTFLDVSRSLAGRIQAGLNQFENFGQFTDLLRARNMTYPHISRALTHILLDIKKSRMRSFVQNDYVGYARMLGFRKESTPLLTAIKANSDVPLISKLKDAKPLLDPVSAVELHSDLYAADLYEQISAQKFNHPFRSEYTQEIVKI